MTTGPEHYDLAERCRERASKAQCAAYNGTTTEGWEKATYWLAAAQVHATLAQAAATEALAQAVQNIPTYEGMLAVYNFGGKS